LIALTNLVLQAETLQDYLFITEWSLALNACWQGYKLVGMDMNSNFYILHFFEDDEFKRT